MLSRYFPSLSVGESSTGLYGRNAILCDVRVANTRIRLKIKGGVNFIRSCRSIIRSKTVDIFTILSVNICCSRRGYIFIFSLGIEKYLDLYRIDDFCVIKGI